jgi:phage baseplate assembly protein W
MFLYKHFVGGQEGVTELDDIVRNLNFVLKTKRGCGYFLETFGLSDVGYRTPEEMIVALTAELEENIRLYEPRVVVGQIDEEYDDAGQRAKLVVALRVRDASERLAIVVDLKKNQIDVRAVKPRGSDARK